VGHRAALDAEEDRNISLFR